MTILRKFARRSWVERRTLVLATALLLITRVTLSLLSFRRTLSLAARLGRARRRPTEPTHLDRWIWALRVAGNRLFPGRPCLPQALVAHLVFRRAGYPSEIRIGTRRGSEGELIAHAWVESGDRVVIGEIDDGDRYVPFPPLPTSTRDG